jgi:hypothetical protein
MSSEYDTLYSFLENLIVQHNTNEETPLQISAVVPDHIEKRKRGRPHGSKTKPKQRCQACFTGFHVERFEKHLTKSKACKKFYDMEIRPPILERPIHELIIDALDNATSVNHKCRFCEVEVVNMKEHMIDSQICNRLAYSVFKTLL